MANEEMIQKHIDNFLAKIAGETPVDDTVQNSTEFWLNKIAEQGGGGGGGAKLYCHHVFLRNTISTSVYLQIINNTETAFTVSTVYNYLHDNGFTTVEKGYGVSGKYNNTEIVLCIYAKDEANTFGIYAPNNDVSITFPTVRDNVVAL